MHLVIKNRKHSLKNFSLNTNLYSCLNYRWVKWVEYIQEPLLLFSWNHLLLSWDSGTFQKMPPKANTCKDFFIFKLSWSTLWTFKMWKAEVKWEHKVKISIIKTVALLPRPLLLLTQRVYLRKFCEASESLFTHPALYGAGHWRSSKSLHKAGL